MPRKAKPAMERFFDCVSPEPNSGCWLWSGPARGGINTWFHPRKYVGVAAHRWGYEQLKGPIPDDLDLYHKCRVSLCVNPDHLEPVTHSVNCKLGITGNHRKGMTHCKYGHPFTEENTYRTAIQRRCKICKARRVNDARTH